MAKDLIINDTLSIAADELLLRFSRSSGPGGQHVNKVETRVELVFNVANSRDLTESQKQRLLKLAAHRADSDQNVVVVSQESRSRSANIEHTRSLLRELILAALKEPKKRVKTSVPPSAKGNRSRSKKKRSATKGNRARVRLSDEDSDAWD